MTIVVAVVSNAAAVVLFTLELIKSMSLVHIKVIRGITIIMTTTNMILIKISFIIIYHSAFNKKSAICTISIPFSLPLARLSIVTKYL